MDEDDRSSSLQFGKQWLEKPVAQVLPIVVAQQPNAFGMQLICSVSDLVKGGIDMREGNSSEHSEPTRVVGHHPACELVCRACGSYGLAL